MILRSATEAIGATPLLCLENIKKNLGLKSDIFAKLEFMNPAGSIKDRAADEILYQAQRAGYIKADTVIVEATSGNMGIGLAFACACKGLKLIVVMPDNMSGEKITLLKAYGAEVVLTDGALGMEGAITESIKIASVYGNAFMPRQFQNKANAVVHYRYTAPEIMRDLKSFNYFVAGVGTGGTITGVGKYLREKLPAAKIIAVEPETSAVLSGGKKGCHQIQGIGAGFVPPLFERGFVDSFSTVRDDDAKSAALLAARMEGCCVGISSGANLHICIELAKCHEYKKIVTVFPDGGEKYISTGLFDKV